MNEREVASRAPTNFDSGENDLVCSLLTVTVPRNSQYSGECNGV